VEEPEAPPVPPVVLPPVAPDPPVEPPFPAVPLEPPEVADVPPVPDPPGGVSGLPHEAVAAAANMVSLRARNVKVMRVSLRAPSTVAEVALSRLSGTPVETIVDVSGMRIGRCAYTLGRSAY